LLNELLFGMQKYPFITTWYLGISFLAQIGSSFLSFSWGGH
jgi:hypothetical protein